jgi:hypothetical protein
MSDNPTTTKRFSYQPECVFGHIPDANRRWTGEYGLKPWPAHMQPRQTASESNGPSEPTAFLAVTPSMRQKLAATCEALIALLDEIDGDENLEETADDEPLLGWPNGKRPTAEMSCDQDREHDDCDLETSHDDERELGWQNEGSQASLHSSMYDGEPDLGWTGHGIGWRDGEETDDREHDAGDDREIEYDGGVEDTPFDDERNCDIAGGGSVNQYVDGWRPDPNYVPPVKKQKKGKRGKNLANSQELSAIPVVLFQREVADSTPMPRYIWNDHWTNNLPPEAHETLIPEISMYWVSK